MQIQTVTFQSEASTGYPASSDFPQLLLACKDLANLIRQEFKTKSLQLVGRGSSGAIICALVGQELVEDYRVKITHVKKSGEESHCSNNMIRLDIDIPIIILDDFMRTGATIEAIIENLPKVDDTTPIAIAFIDEITDRQVSILEDMAYNITHVLSKLSRDFIPTSAAVEDITDFLSLNKI
tara:strand:+ start:1717 stop:2259 length:543 start_codon:yes stop_codon:yes gene_type:complete